MSNYIASDKQVSILHHLAEGNSIRATSRLCRVHRNTVMRHLVEFGEACQNFMDLSFDNLNLRHVEIDEIWTFVGKKQGKLTDREKRNPKTTEGDAYLFIGLDEDTKLIPGYVLGKRNRENTEKLADMLADREPQRFQTFTPSGCN